MWASKNRQESQGLVPGRKTIGPLFLMTACPLAVLGLATLNQKYQGNLVQALLGPAAPDRTFEYGSVTAAIIVFAIVQLIFLRVIPPVKEVKGPLTPAGLRATYMDNGLTTFFTTIVLFVTFSDLGPVKLYPIDVWVNNLPELFVMTNVFSFTLCTWLVVRTWYVPHSKDYSTTGNIVADYYVGRELHPTFLGGIDVKQFTNCRFGMMLWPVMCVSSVGHEYKVFGTVSNASLVSFGLQMLYLTKFFLWEKGYFYTIDMMHDRAGFYLCWGCINWVPCLYANVSIFMAWAPHTEDMSSTLAIATFAFGVVQLFLNYHSDLQRQQFRAADGNYTILGRKAQYLTATFKTEDGKEHSSKLLTSGYWGTSRHFNYLAELTFTY
eukprot:PhF_6_TR32179/c0_g1_i1/m.47764/K00213/DHCR7; 7-dehydrocholesterol reductase